MEESLADLAIKSLQETANRLIAEQAQSKATIFKADATSKQSTCKLPILAIYSAKRAQRAPTVIKSIGAAGSSIFQLADSKTIETELPPHESKFAVDLNFSHHEGTKYRQPSENKGRLVV